MGKAVDLGQPKPGAFAERLGREERLEDSRQHVGRNTDTRIRHCEGNEVAFQLIDPVAFLQGDVSRRQRNEASAWHGIAGIDRDVHQCELELGNVYLDRPDIRCNIAFELDVSAQRADQHFMHGLNPLLEVGDHRVERLAS